jgi:hypothetical protein
VAVDRGADALAVTGWRGPVNYFDQVSPLAAVVRSWEDRFGVRLLGIGFETLYLSVAAPPVTFEHAVHVAAEHWMFCSVRSTRCPLPTTPASRSPAIWWPRSEGWIGGSR